MKVAEASIQIIIWIKNWFKKWKPLKNPDNKDKIPFTFDTESIEPNVSEEGQFKILGIVNQDNGEDIEFNLELTYPTGYMTKCILPKASYSNVEITCILGDPLQDYVDIKHQVIRDGIIKLFTFTAISSHEKLHWDEET